MIAGNRAATKQLASSRNAADFFRDVSRFHPFIGHEGP